MERKLVMSFKDIAGAKFNLIVNSVKDEVTEEEIEARYSQQNYNIKRGAPSKIHLIFNVEG